MASGKQNASPFDSDRQEMADLRERVCTLVREQERLTSVLREKVKRTQYLLDCSLRRIEQAKTATKRIRHALNRGFGSS